MLLRFWQKLVLMFALVLAMVCFVGVAYAQDAGSATVSAGSIDWHPLVSALLQGIAGVVALMVPVVFAQIIRKVQASHLDDETKRLLQRMSGVMSVVVAETFQTTIDAARKKAGMTASLPAEVAQAAMAETLTKLKSYTNPEDIKRLAEIYALDSPEKVDAFLRSNIEATIRLYKPNVPQAGPVGFQRG